jgi:hypothetical protein
MIRFLQKIGGFAILAALVLANLAVNVPDAQAHYLGYHWHKSGTQIVLRTYIYPSTVYAAAAERARQDGWNKIAILYNQRVYDPNYAEVHVWDAAYGNTGWSGYGGFDRVTNDGRYHGLRGYALYNRSTGWTNQNLIQGLFCQEIGHAWGLDHHNNGDCMGLTYFNWNGYYYGSHTVYDFNSRYRSHQ